MVGPLAVYGNSMSMHTVCYNIQWGGDGAVGGKNILSMTVSEKKYFVCDRVRKKYYAPIICGSISLVPLNIYYITSIGARASLFVRHIFIC